MLAVRSTLDKMLALKPAWAKVGPIGMDIGASSINLCQLKQRSEHGFSVLAKASIPFSEARSDLIKSSKRLKKLLAQGMEKRGFSNRKVVAVMPPDKLKILPVTYKSNVADAGQEILRMLSSRLEGDIEDYIIDYLPVRSNAHDDEHLALATVARRDDVMEYLQALTQAGFIVEALDVGPAALRRLISSLYIDEPAETILVINVGIDTTYLTVISGRRLLFDQPVGFGEHALLQDLSKALELPPGVCRELVFRHGMKPPSAGSMGLDMMQESDYSQAILEILKPAFLKMVEEINRVMIFTASETHGRPVSQIILLGGLARWPGSDALLRELINIPLSSIKDSFDHIFEDQSEPGSRWSDQVPELAVATGLALRGLVDNG